MPYFEEWKTYTKAVVKLSYRDRNGAGSSYVISNVNTKGFPDAGCGAHLESISITSPAIGGGQDTIKSMERYIKRYSNSNKRYTQIKVHRMKKALEVMHQIKWDIE